MGFPKVFAGPSWTDKIPNFKFLLRRGVFCWVSSISILIKHHSMQGTHVWFWFGRHYFLNSPLLLATHGALGKVTHNPEHYYGKIIRKGWHALYFGSWFCIDVTNWRAPVYILSYQWYAQDPGVPFKGFHWIGCAEDLTSRFKVRALATNQGQSWASGNIWRPHGQDLAYNSRASSLSMTSDLQGSSLIGSCMSAALTRAYINQWETSLKIWRHALRLVN